MSTMEQTWSYFLILFQVLRCFFNIEYFKFGTCKEGWVVLLLFVVGIKMFFLIPRTSISVRCKEVGLLLMFVDKVNKLAFKCWSVKKERLSDMLIQNERIKKMGVQYTLPSLRLEICLMNAIKINNLKKWFDDQISHAACQFSRKSHISYGKNCV